MKKTLPSIRVPGDLRDNIDRSIIQYNKKNLRKLDDVEFRRYAYELLSNLIIQDKLKDIEMDFE